MAPNAVRDHTGAWYQGDLVILCPDAAHTGVYSEVDADGPVAGHALYYRAEVEPGVVLVTGPGGRGMTCSPAIA
jgi:glycine/D-amino acid oxidase-like deaminating enzyme